MSNEDTKSRGFLTAVKKRFRSGQAKESPSKRQKDLLEGNLEDFLYLLENSERLLTLLKPGSEPEVAAVTMDMSQEQSTSHGDDPKNKELLEVFGPLFRQLENNLSNKIDELNAKLTLKDEKITVLENKVEKLEQQLKRNNLTFHGISDTKTENPTLSVIDMVKKNLKVEMKEQDIDECFRLGQKEAKNRPILVKFATNAKKQEIYKAKKLLKNVGDKYYINEDLTKEKAELHKKTRKLIAERYIWKSWTFNANIYYTLTAEDLSPKLIKSEDDIAKIRKDVTPREDPNKK